MQRLRLYDLRLSRLPDRLGLCQGDLPQLCDYINSAQERLMNAREAGDEGWWGGWAEILFTISRTMPYVTMPREIARVERVDVCGKPVPTNNPFYEYLEYGNGRLPKHHQHHGGNWWPLTEVMTRDNAVTFYSLLPTPQLIQIFVTNAADAGGDKRVLIQGTDASGSTVYSQDGNSQVSGIYVTLGSPFVTTPFAFATITGIQKDVTSGQIQFFQVDPSTGVSNPLHQMEPSETTALYRRYYFNDLPCNCCHTPSVSTTTVQASAIVKLELIPVTADPDYTLIQSKEAIINECEAIRYEGMDNPNSHQMADRKHVMAIRLLNGELSHRLGKDSPAVNFAPFGSAKLSRQQIGTMI